MGKKSVLFFVILFTVIVVFALKITESQPQDNSEVDQTPGKVGDYIVTVADYLTFDTKYGDKILVVTYSFTNKSNESVSMYHAINDTAYQKGIEIETPYENYICERYYVEFGELYDYESYFKKILPGATIEVKRAYMLDGVTSDVVIELSSVYGPYDEPDLRYRLNLLPNASNQNTAIQTTTP